MAKLRLTKNELKKQKEALKRFTRYLPMLELKKQQLVVEIKKIDEMVKELEVKIEGIEKDVDTWVGLFAEEVSLESLLKIKNINTEVTNIAGIEIPLFNSVEFDEKAYDYMTTPLWVDKALSIMKELIRLRVQIQVYLIQQKILKEELRVTVQRINLFDKVMIPQAKNHIRIIQIYLGDLQTAEVVRGKIAKTKLAKKAEMAIA
jgi:V/A-type H+-transporting ATPase subunit D